jgi:3-phosphoshikimate 1-carboxyvinyltransferase
MKARTSPLRGELQVPGDKSLSHRALIFGALATGESRVHGLNRGDDVAATAACLAALGAVVNLDGPDATVRPPDGGRLVEPTEVLDAGNSGTTLRTLAALCAGIEGLSVLTGDSSLRRRPMLRVVAPLREMGAVIDGREHGTLPPLCVRGGHLRAIDKEIDVASAQVKTAIVLAGMAAPGVTTVTEPGPSRDHTERMLQSLKVPLSVDGRTVAVTGPARPEAFSFRVPGDVSSALFLVVAALLVPGSDLVLTGVGLNPTRIGALEVLRAMGADISWSVTDTQLGEPLGTVSARHSPLNGTEVGGVDLVPTLIDEIPILSVAATQATGRTVFRDSRELRLKETDRIAAMSRGLGALGAEVTPTDDGLVVEGPTELEGGRVESYGDHRVAMSLAVAGLVARSKVSVQGWSAVDTSFPEFLDLLGRASRAR